MKINMNAKFNEKEIQLFSELNDELNDIRTEISNRAMNLEDELIKEALIKLGWTPPSSNPELCDGTKRKRILRGNLNDGKRNY